MRSRDRNPLVSDVLRVLANEDSLEIFSVVAIKKKVDTKTLRYSQSFGELTNKQYYTRLQDLAKLNLVKRVEGSLLLTSFGAVVYHGKIKIDNAIDEYYNLKAVDSFEKINEMDQNVRHELIKNIVHDEGIKKVLLGENFKS